MNSIVLFSPEIPGNTGSIGRTCLALEMQLILIHPLGFELSEKSVRRAGLDYWKDVGVKEYPSWKNFLEDEQPKKEELWFFTKTAKSIYYDQNYAARSYLVFGSETKGLPAALLTEYSDRLLSLPMRSPKVRSLNLANAATAAAYELHRCVSSNLPRKNDD